MNEIFQKYSALISIYNKEKPKFLDEALNSMSEQTVLPSQVVIVEDGPLSESLLDIIRKFRDIFINKNIDVTIVKNKKNSGLGISLNKGVRYCKYEIVARFDSDDINVKSRIEKILPVLVEDGVAVVGSNIAEFKGNIQNIINYRKVPETENECAKFSISRNPLNHMTVIFKKKYIMSVGGYEDVPYFEDYYLWLKLINEGYRVKNISDILVYARINDTFYARRSGLTYFRKEYNFQKKIYHEKMISRLEMIKNIILRGIIRLLPQKAVKGMYKILRN